MNGWGKHLVLDCHDCDLIQIKDASNIASFSKTLVEKIDMVAFGEPWIVRFGAGNKAGYTLVQLIETSNICAHFSEEEGSAYIDIFSCKDFDVNEAMNVVEDFFSPKGVTYRVLDRDATKVED